MSAVVDCPDCDGRLAGGSVEYQCRRCGERVMIVSERVHAFYLQLRGEHRAD